MTAGLRVEIAVGAPGDCTVADASARASAPVSSVSRASIPDATGRIAEEFAIEEDGGLERPGVAAVAAYGDRTIYRFRRSRDEGCVCERIEAVGYPVSAVHARDGTLYVSFHAPDVDAVRTIVGTLREGFSGVRIRKLTQFDGGSDRDLVFVDRGRLTDRQREVLRTAYDMGYFEHPKGANAGEVAAAIGISPSTFAEHLATAQRKVMDAVLTP
ncbi:helix-turn-helix domain-containing protein [Halomarina halobia]|uniref:Helix-turn-helix domain-containing protein n=1 Tax=Halomarina halobia TaxID=3033386 RepID=A0ABD6ADB8_9EURY|nr:helix-turn-helix domain-containing protein [Halomarina sp. PSR21]